MTEQIYTANGRRIEATVIDAVPTVALPEGFYKVVCKRGLYWGLYKVTTNWCGEKFVMEWY